MTKTLHLLALALALALVFAFALASTAIVRTQEPAAYQPIKTQDTPASKAVTPLKVQIVISRFQGEKKIGSMPFTLSVNATNNLRESHANLRMGAKIPITMMAPLTVDGQKGPGMATTGPIQYQDVGTNIDCQVASLDDGRFRVEITVDDTSVYPDDQGAAGATKGSPSFRSFRASDSMVLKDGAAAQFTTATDKVSGEVVKVDVTLTVVK